MLSKPDVSKWSQHNFPHLTPTATSLKLIVWGTCRKFPILPCLSASATTAAPDKEITWITQQNRTHSTILRTLRLRNFLLEIRRKRAKPLQGRHLKASMTTFTASTI